jgi:ABC-type uncharacterized transport system permease subunit
MNLVLGVFAICLYISAAALRLTLHRPLPISPRQLVIGLGSIALLLHAFLLYQNTLLVQGFNLGIFNAASLMTWAIALMLLFTVLSKPVDNLIIVFFPLSALAIGLDLAFQSERILSPNTELGVSMHVLTSIVAYSFLTISALQALFLAYQDYQLRHKHPGWVMRKLPPLQVMEVLLFQMLMLGFIFLTLSLLSGFIFLEDIFAQHLVHKTVLSLIAWAVFAALLWGRKRYGWRGQTAIRWNLSGFFFLMLAYFGSKLVLELILKR